MLKFPTWAVKEPLEQAERQAAWPAKWLGSAIGASVTALPVLALPGWFGDRTGRGAIRVFNGKELAGLLEVRGARSLSMQQLQQVAHQPEQRCRTVAPRYNDEAKASLTSPVRLSSTEAAAAKRSEYRALLVSQSETDVPPRIAWAVTFGR